jgi:hypothetical protein
MALADVTIHSSQFPENIRRELLDGLRAHRVNPKFHYDSHKQAQKWLALHEAFSPSRTDPGCLAIYDSAFAAAAERLAAEKVQVMRCESGAGADGAAGGARGRWGSAVFSIGLRSGRGRGFSGIVRPTQ